MYILRNQRTLGTHPQFPRTDATEAAHFHIEEHLIVATAPDRRQRKFDVFTALIAIRHRFVADAHQRQSDTCQTEMIVADKVALFGQSFALNLHLPDMFCVLEAIKDMEMERRLLAYIHFTEMTCVSCLFRTMAEYEVCQYWYIGIIRSTVLSYNFINTVI